MPSLIHSLSAEVAIHTFINLKNLIVIIQEMPSNNENYYTNNKFYGSNLSLSASISSDKWNPVQIFFLFKIYLIIFSAF